LGKSRKTEEEVKEVEEVWEVKTRDSGPEISLALERRGLG
jgi:hypothetical protein